MAQEKTYYLFLYFFIFALAVFFLFLPALRSYFFQDDWFSFYISRAQNWQELATFLIPRTDVIYYRPVGVQIPFFLVQKLFGISPLPFKAATFLLHNLNGILVYLLLTYFLKKRLLGLLGTFLYLTSATHQVLFYWSATFAFMLGSSLYLSAFLAVLYQRRVVALVLFVVGLLTNELLVTLPLMLTWWEWSSHKKKIFRYWYFWLISFLYLSVRVIWKPVPATADYSLTADLTSPFLTLRNFSLWALNWPEEIKAQFTKFIFLNPLFIAEFQSFVLLFSLVTLSFVIGFIMVPVIVLWRTRKLQKSGLSTIALGSSWFVIASLPVLFFAQHSFTYYVPLPLVGLLLCGLSLVNQILNLNQRYFKRVTLFLIVFSALWYFSAVKNVSLNRLIHWAPQRADRSYDLIVAIRRKYPQVPPGTTVIIERSEKEIRWSLGEENALKVIYADPTIKTYFGSVGDYLTSIGIVDPLKQQFWEPYLYKIP